MIQQDHKVLLPYLFVSLIVALSILGKDVIAQLWSNPQTPTQKHALRTPPTSAHEEQTSATNNLLQQANNHYARGDMPQAIQIYQKALKDHPHLLQTLLRLGNAHVARNEHEQAQHYYKSILAIDPNNMGAYICLGVTHQNLKQHAEAVTAFNKALKFYPNFYDAHLQLSVALCDLERYDEALASAQKAESLKPNIPEPYIQQGYIYNKIGDTKKAVPVYKKALKIDGNNVTALQSLGYSLRLQGDMHEAIPYLKKAISINPNHVDAHIGLAFCHWAMGNYEQAWQEYEWRWKIHGMNPAKMDTPMLNANSIKDKTILLYPEQGMGDTLQYVRYAKELKQRGAKQVICRVQKPLKTLLSCCEYIDRVVVDEKNIKADYQAPLMSMPLILGTRADNIPMNIPYLKADEKLVLDWKEKLQHDKNFKIGLCWHVDPIHEEVKSPIAKRSIPLKLFAPLANNKNVSFYSLQKIVGEDQLNDLPQGFKVSSFGKDFDKKHGSFMDTAAVMESLDLIISVDTSVVHVAGAMDKEVWTILPYSPDPRFHAEGDVMPWYPSMKLFRTEKPFDWESSIAQVNKELQRKLAQR